MKNRYYLGNFWYRLFKAIVFVPLVRFIWRPTVIGAENIPTGGAILAANHLDAGDTLSLPASVKPAMIFPAKKELFEGKTFSKKIVAKFLTAIGQVPIDRGGGKEGVSSLSEVEEKLDRGAVIGIFPEGSRSVDGRMYKGHTGVARLALDTGKPVVPVGLINTYLRRGLFGIPHMSKAKIIIGTPVDYSKYAGHSHDVKVMRWVTNDIMAKIQEISGQQYVDVYLSRVKRGKMTAEQLQPYLLDKPELSQEPPIV